MATRKKRAAPARPRKSRSPARVRKRAKKTRGHHHPELWGLGLVAAGLVLSTVVWLGWDGGPVGARVSDWLRDGVGAAAPLVPFVLVTLGGLMLVRSALVDLRPFRTGIAVGGVGSMVALGEGHGGALGAALGGALARVIGEPGSLIVGATLVLAGLLLVTGASAGAVLRRSGHAVRQAGTVARRSLESLDWTDWSDSESAIETTPEPLLKRKPAPLDGMEAYPDVVADGPFSAEPPPLLPPVPLEVDEPTADVPIFDPPSTTAAYRLPERSLLNASPPARGDSAEVSARTAQMLVQTLSQLRCRGDDRRHDRRPARRPLRAPTRARDEGLEGRGSEGRPVVRARDDGDPHPRPDSGEAGGRRGGSEPRAADGHARRHLRRPARHRQPALRVARQGHLRQLRLDRPRPHAASPDRGDDGLGEVGLHQHPADLDPAPRDPGRRADDPDRPEADRARTSTSRFRTC